MITERKWLAVAPVQLTAQGSASGKITVTSTRGFRVKMRVSLSRPNAQDIELEVKRVTSSKTLELGLPGKSIDDRSDLSAFDTSAFIYSKEQNRSNIPIQELARAVYEEEPALAIRTIGVDQFGSSYSVDNPLPVQLSDGSINIENLNAELRVQLSAKDNDPKPGDVHSSVRVGDGTNELAVNSDGSFNVHVVESSASSTPGMVAKYNEISAVSSGSESNVISLTAGPDGFRITQILASGENIALFRVKIDGITISSKRSWWTAFNVEWIFESVKNGLLLRPGQVLTVTALHTRPSTSDFEATIIGS